MKPVFFLIVFLFFLLNFASVADNSKECIVKSEFIYKAEEVNFPSCHASTILETKNGLLAAWFGGTEEKNPDVCIYTAVYQRGHWEKPVKTADGIEDGKKYPCWNPVLFRKDNGDIVLFYKVGPDPRSWWGMFKISKDEGNTWSAPFKIPGNLLGPIKNKPVRLNDGKILYPTSFETPEKWNLYFETSDQNLENWQKTIVDNNNLNNIQPTVLFHKDGSLQLLCRSRNKNINESWSKDNGKSWSPVTPTQLPNNNSGIDAVTLADGRQLLVYNPIEKGRNRLAVAISEDGRKWETAAMLEDDPFNGEYSYPAVIQSKNGMVHITYTWKRELIKHVVIDPVKIRTGSPGSEKQENDGFRTENIFPFQNRHVHSSSLVELPNGDLLSCWFEGSGERSANDVMIRGARLRQGKSGWSEPFILADTPDHPDCNPVLFLDGLKRLHLCWVVVNANQWETSILKTRISENYEREGPPLWKWQDIILIKPGDDFVSVLEKKFTESGTPDLAWAAYAPLYEKMIVEAAKDSRKRDIGWMGRINPTFLPSGRILMPLYSDGFNLSLVAVSDDQGDTWKSSGPIVGRGNIQPAIVRKKDGTLVAYMRDNGDAPGRIQVSTSSDDGMNWSISKKSNLPNSGASVSAINLASGDWLLVYNDLEDGRYRLAVSLSDNEGQSWKFKKYLENDETRKGGFAYPNAIQTKDGMIHVSYSYSVDGNKTIRHARFAESWLIESVN